MVLQVVLAGASDSLVALGVAKPVAYSFCASPAHSFFKHRNLVGDSWDPKPKTTKPQNPDP